MESFRQHISPTEENDRQSSASSAMMSEDELQDPQTTDKTSQEQVTQDLNTNNAQSKESTKNLKSGDLESMVQNYKQIGGELMYNLKILENRRHALNKKLTEVSRECKILFQQKEFQMKALVDLQIKLENLDMERVKILKENQEDKIYKTEIFTHQFQSLLENDDYLRTTYNKFHDVLKTEKSNFENLLNSTRNDKELNRKAGETYNKKMGEIMKDFRRESEVLLEKENKAIAKLDQAMFECKELITEEIRLHRERGIHEKELKSLNGKHSKLNSIFIQKKQALKEAEKMLNERKKSYQIRLHELNKDIAKFKEECDSIFEEYERQAKQLTDKNLEFVALKNEADKLKSDLMKIQSEKSLKQDELSSLINEFNLLTAKLENVKCEGVFCETQSAELPTHKENLDKLQVIEDDLRTFVEKLKAEILAQVELLEDAKNREQVLKSQVNKVQHELEELETSVKLSNEEEVELSEHWSKYSFDSENLLTERNKELSELALMIENYTSVDNQLNDDVNQAERNINDMEINLQHLNEEVTRVGFDDCNLKEEEEDIEILKNNLGLLENELIDVDSKLEELTRNLEGARDIEEMESEIKRIDFEIKEASLSYNEQVESIESSFGSQTKNLEDKYTKEIKDIAREAKEEEGRTKRMTEAVPRLTQDIGILECDLKKLLPALVKEIGNALHKLVQLADFYNKAIDENKKKGSKASTERNLTAIEEQLAKPMKCMMSLEGMPKVDISIRAPDKYKHVINAFQEKHAEILNQVDSNPALEMAEKLQEIGSYVFGKKWVKPSYSQVLNDAEISSSTVESFY